MTNGILLTIVMLLGMLPTLAFEEETDYVAWIGETGYETLEAAVKAPCGICRRGPWCATYKLKKRAEGTSM